MATLDRFIIVHTIYYEFAYVLMSGLNLPSFTSRALIQL